jgi:glycosyltransferase involved in cell wall biosynthesis
MTKVGILAMARQRNGGTLPYTLSLIEALKRLPPERYRFTLYTAVDNHEYDDAGLPLVGLPGPAGFVAALLTGGDAFEAVDAVLAPIYSTRLLATSRPFAFTLHDLQEKHYPEYFSATTRAWRHVTNRLLTARARRIVCESSFVRDDIVAHFGVPPERIAVVPAPPASTLRDVSLDDAALEAVRRKFSLPARCVFYPAQFWPHKNHRRLVEAFALVASQFPDCALVFTGKPRDEYERVFAQVRALGLSDRVRHAGHVEQAELAALYRCATLVAVPTLFESISIPVYEAFMLGTPVCASNVVALPEQIGDAGLLFDPLSVNDIAAALRRLLTDEALRRELVARGRQRFAAVTHDGYARRLADVIDALQAPPRVALA